MTTIYDTILANIQADPKAWCAGSYQISDDGKKISACLVGHVDLALRTCYIRGVGRGGKPNYFISKDKRKWTRRHRVVAHLAALIAPEDKFTPGEDEPIGAYPDHYPAVKVSVGEEIVTTWNDDDAIDEVCHRSPAEVTELLKTAAKTYPND